MNPPPPPPPHGENPRRPGGGLPDGKYDIFIIPPHSSGNGFLYLPSLKPNANSFIAGFATCLVLSVLFHLSRPVFEAWYVGLRTASSSLTLVLIAAIAIVAWTAGKAQGEGPAPGAGQFPPRGDYSNPWGSQEHTRSDAPPPNSQNTGPPPQPSAAPPPPQPPPPQAERPKPTWNRSTPAPETSNPPPSTPKSKWEQAREETKKKEEERKAAEEAKKRREENERKLKEMREKDARERAAREQKAKGDADLKARTAADQKGKDGTPKPNTGGYAYSATGEKTNPWSETKNGATHNGSSYAHSATGEKMNPWPNGRPVTPTSPKKPPPPTARTYHGTEDDAFSYRPYDKPKQPTRKKSQSSLYSEASYAASQSTSRTTPPPSHRGPYSTKDPDKIVIKAVYSFNNSGLKIPTSQLVSGIGAVTDGLILRITTEGLFIDDDVRGVPQREWDIKAWTMKMVEVWCPAFNSSASPCNPAFGASGRSPNSGNNASGRPSNPVRRLWNLEKDKTASIEDQDAYVAALNSTCKSVCRFGSASSSSSASASSDPFVSSARIPTNGKSNGKQQQTGKNDLTGYHVLRASIRDQEGKRYIFVLREEEAWKVTVGLGKLRKGSQVRALSVSAMSVLDARSTLEHLGWV